MNEKQYIITEPQLMAIEIVLKQAGIPLSKNLLLTEIRSCVYNSVPNNEPCRECDFECHQNQIKDAAAKVRSEVLEEVYKRLEAKRQNIWQSPQSYGQIMVVTWSDIDCLFAELKGEKK
jgi:hypothetical protein